MRDYLCLKNSLSSMKALSVAGAWVSVQFLVANTAFAGRVDNSPIKVKLPLEGVPGDVYQYIDEDLALIEPVRGVAREIAAALRKVYLESDDPNASNANLVRLFDSTECLGILHEDSTASDAEDQKLRYLIERAVLNTNERRAAFERAQTRFFISHVNVLKTRSQQIASCAVCNRYPTQCINNDERY